MVNAAGIEIDENGRPDLEETVKAVNCGLLYDMPNTAVYRAIMDSVVWMKNRILELEANHHNIPTQHSLDN